MSVHENHNNQYSAKDIRRYINGQMNAREMNALEKAALEDPFLQDAIDGYLQNRDRGELDFTKDLEEIRNRLHTRTGYEENKVVSLRRNKPWAVAAVILLLAGTGLLVYFLLNPSESGKRGIAKNETVSSQDSYRDSSSVNIVPPPAETRDLAKNKAGATTAPVPFKETTVNKEERESAKTMMMEKSSIMQAPQPDSFTQDTQITFGKAPQKVSTETQPRLMKPMANARKDEDAYTFSGIIVDKENKPVPGASIFVLNNQLGVITDSNGSFNFSLNDSLAFVAVESSGFETANATLKKDLANHEIRLKEIPQAIAMQGNVALKKQKPEPDSSLTKTQDAEPLIGWTAYRTYLEKNKKYPATAIHVHGDVIISFDVESHGIPKNFSIEKSLARSLDEEAIRLVKEGPGWKVLKGNAARVFIVVKF